MKLPQIQQNFNDASTSFNMPKPDKNEPFWGSDGFTFGDVIDVFNPLHHLPVVAKYYREQTHDDACEGAKVMGGALFGALMGGATGVISSMANSMIRHETQQDVTDHLIATIEESFDLPDTENLDTEFITQKSALESEPLLSQNQIKNPFFDSLFEQPNDQSQPGYDSDRASKLWGKV